MTTSSRVASLRERARAFWSRPQTPLQVASASALAASFITGKVVAVILGTTGVGIQAVVLGAGSLTAILSTWGFANALPSLLRASPDSRALDYSRSIARATAYVFPLVFGLSAYAVIPELVSVYRVEVVFCGLLASAIAAILITIRPTMLAVFSDSRSAARNQLVGAGATTSATSMAVWLLPPGLLPVSVGCGLLVGQVVAWNWSRHDRKTWQASQRITSPTLIKLTWPIFSSVALSAGAIAAVPLLVLHISGSAEVGLLRAAMSLGSIPVAVMTTGIALHYYPRVAESVRHNEDTYQVTTTSVRQVVRPAVVLSLALCVLAPIVLWLSYSQAFVSAAPILAFVAATAPLQLLAFHNAYLLLAHGRRHAYFLAEVAASTALLGLVAFGAWTGVSWALGAAVWGTYLLHLLVTRQLLRGQDDRGASVALLGKRYVVGIAIMPAVALTYAFWGSG